MLLLLLLQYSPGKVDIEGSPETAADAEKVLVGMTYTTFILHQLHCLLALFWDQHQVLALILSVPL